MECYSEGSLLSKAADCGQQCSCWVTSIMLPSKPVLICFIIPVHLITVQAVFLLADGSHSHSEFTETNLLLSAAAMM